MQKAGPLARTGLVGGDVRQRVKTAQRQLSFFSSLFSITWVLLTSTGRPLS